MGGARAKKMRQMNLESLEMKIGKCAYTLISLTTKSKAIVWRNLITGVVPKNLLVESFAVLL